MSGSSKSNLATKKVSKSKSPARQRKKEEPVEQQQQQLQQQEEDAQLEFQTTLSENSDVDDEEEEEDYQNTVQTMAADMDTTGVSRGFIRVNEEVLEEKAPQLLQEQDKHLEKSMFLRRRGYKTQLFKRAANLPSWTQNGAELVADYLLKGADGKSRTSAPVKKSKSKKAVGKSIDDNDKDVKELPKPKAEFDEDFNKNICIHHGDMTEIEADMLVVSCSDPSGDSGVSKQIIKDAGDSMKLELKIAGKKRLADRADDCLTFDVVHSFVKRGDTQGLKKFYENAFAHASDMSCSSIVGFVHAVFTCLGTGGMGMNGEKAAEIALETTRTLMSEGDIDEDMRVIFCCKKDGDLDAYIRACSIYFPLAGDTIESAKKKGPKTKFSFENTVRPALEAFTYSKLLEPMREITNLTSLDLTCAPDVVTDITFFCLREAYANATKPKMKELKLSYADQLTDCGLLFALQTYRKLDKLELFCCPNLTERSLNLAEIEGLIGKKEIAETRKTMMIDKGSTKETSTLKVVIIRDGATNSVMKTTSSKEKEVFGCMKMGLVNYNTLSSGGTNINIYEVDISVAHLFLNWGCVAVIPNEDKESANSTAEAILAMPSFCGTLIVPEERTKSHCESIVTTSIRKVELMLIEELRTKQFAWSEVVSLSNLAALSQRMSIIKSGNLFTSEKALQVSSDTDSKSFASSLIKVTESNKTVSALYRYNVPTKGSETVIGQEFLAEMFSTTPMAKVPEHKTKWACILHDLGDIWYDPTTRFAVFDVGLLSKTTHPLTQSLNFNQAMDRNTVPWMKGNQTGVFRYLTVYDYLMDKSKGKVPMVAAEQFIECLQLSGLVAHVPHAWLNDITQTPAGVMMQSLNGSQAEMEKLFPMKCDEEDQDRTVHYNLKVNATSALARCILTLSRLLQSTFIRKTGLIGQYGCVEIRICQSSQACKYSAGDWEKLRANLTQTLVTTFSMIRLIVEAQLVQAGYGFSQEFDCISCREERNDLHRLTSAAVQDGKCPVTSTSIMPTVYELSHFKSGCSHSQLLVNCTTDRTLTCTLCAKTVRLYAKEQTCKACHMCSECMKLIKVSYQSLNRYESIVCQDNGEVIKWTKNVKPLFQSSDNSVASKMIGSSYVCQRCRQRFTRLKACFRHEQGCQGERKIMSNLKQEQLDYSDNIEAAELLNQRFPVYSDQFQMGNQPLMLTFSLDYKTAEVIRIQPLEHPDKVYIRLHTGNTIGQDLPLSELMTETSNQFIEVAIEWHFDCAQLLIRHPEWSNNPSLAIETLKPVGEFSLIFCKRGASVAVTSSGQSMLVPVVTTVDKNQVLEVAVKDDGLVDGEVRDRMIVLPGMVSAYNEDGQFQVTCGDNIDPIYVSLDHEHIHPIGYAAQTETLLIEPYESFDWRDYIKKYAMAPFPFILYNKKQRLETPEIRVGLNKDVKLSIAKDGWIIGMRLEALDRLNPTLVCVATVKDVKKSHGKVTVTFDGWTDRYDYEADTSSEDLHPIGWCAHVNHKLEAPKGYQKQFRWFNYLQEVSQAPVPYELFNRNQTSNCPRHPIYDGAYTDNDDDVEIQDGDGKIAMCLRVHSWFYNWIGKQTNNQVHMALMSKIWGDLPTSEIRKSSQVGNPKSDCYSLFLLYDLNQAWTETKGLYIMNVHRGQVVDYVASHLSPYPIKNDIMPDSLPVSTFQSHATYIPPHNYPGPSSCMVEPYHVAGWHEAVDSDTVKKSLGPNIHAIIDAIAPLLLEGHRMLIRSRLDPSGNIDRIFETTKTRTSDKDTKPSGHSLNKLETLYHALLVTGCTLAAFTVNAYLCTDCMTETCRGNCVSMRGKENKDEQQAPDNVRAKYDMQYVSSFKNKLSNPKFGVDVAASICGFCTAANVKNADVPTSSRIHMFNHGEVNEHAHIVVTETIQQVKDSISNIDFSKFQRFKQLTMLIFPRMSLSDLPDEFSVCTETLIYLDVSKNPFKKIPDVVFKLRSLRYLNLTQCAIRKLSPNIAALSKLEVLLMPSNFIDENAEHLRTVSKLTQLRILDISAVKRLEPDPLLQTMNGQRVREHLTNYYAVDDKIVKQLLDVGIDVNSPQVIEKEEDLKKLDEIVNFRHMKRFISLPPDIFELRCLRQLLLADHAIQKIRPNTVSKCHQLEVLVLERNSELTNIDQDIGNLQYVSIIAINSCPKLTTPPLEVAKRGTTAIMAYFRRLLGGRKFCKRTKLMFCGLGGAGKTSMVKKLKDGVLRNPDEADCVITDGIDIEEWTVKILNPDDGKEVSINYSMWDFAGQSVYYNTHQFFLSDRAIYFLLWNARLGYEHAGLDFWLSSIASHAPKAPIFVIATHCDQVFRTDLPAKQLKIAFPQIVDFFAISCVTGAGFEELQKTLLTITQQQTYMNEEVPTTWLKLEKDLVSARKESSVLDYTDISELANKHDILDTHDIRQALEFLHDLGSVQYFKNEFLRDKVVINPQWLVDVMACLISVKESVIVEGRFNRADINKVWEKHPELLHDWLLKLTEEFDLTFYMAQEKVNIVPCLLPEQEPDFMWPELTPEHSEMKLVYSFDYLPTGLFNRTQSRLCQYSDTTVIWKRGSFLNKNQHIALIRETREKEIILVVQGLRPENILFLVHEIIETLINDFYHGVKYDLSIPCVDCLKVGTQNPHMFSQKQIRRAIVAQAPVLQCDKNFHICALAALQELLPPSNTNEYTHHLAGMMHDLDSMKTSVAVDALILCSQADLKDSSNRLKTDLKAQGDIRATIIPIGGSPEQHNESMKTLSYKISSCHVVLVLVTDGLCADTNSANVISYIKQQTHRSFIAVIGYNSEKNWHTTSVGLFVTEEIYVDCQDFAGKYEQRLPEIVSRCKASLRTSRSMNANPKNRSKQSDVFISYCWLNSKDAGDRKDVRVTVDSITGADPRAVDKILTDNGIQCWLDVRCMRKGALFEEICNGLRGTKLVLVFISDQYLNSRNCKLEFNFAAAILKKPMILCPVGKGNTWQTSQIAFLAVGAVRVDPTKEHELIAEVKRQLDAINAANPDTKVHPKDRNVSPSKADASMKAKEYDAYKEVCELAQRKFSQTVTKAASFARAKDTSMSKVYPRLVYIDINDSIEIMDEKDTAKSVSKKGAKMTAPGRTARSQSPSNDKPNESGSRARSVSRRPKPKVLTYTDKTPITKDSQANGEESEDKKTISKTIDVKSAIAQLSMTDFVVRYLCEIDGVWHLTGMPLEVTDDSSSVEDFFTKIAAYQAAIMSVLQHSAVQVNLFQLTKWPGAMLQHFKELMMDEKYSSFEKSYLHVWRIARNADRKIERAGLTRCALHSRRVVWLCEEHKGIARGQLSDDFVETEDASAAAIADATLPSAENDQQKSPRATSAIKKSKKPASAKSRKSTGSSSSRSSSKSRMSRTDSAKSTSTKGTRLPTAEMESEAPGDAEVIIVENSAEDFARNSAGINAQLSTEGPARVPSQGTLYNSPGSPTTVPNVAF